MKRAKILDVEKVGDEIIIDLEYETDAADEGPDIIGIYREDILDAVERRRAINATLKLLWLLSIATRRKK